jgi:Protein of unknown function (DUF1579)
MELKRSLIVALALSTAAAAHAQDMFEMPKPGPEHELLKKDVGTWDATVEMLMPPAPPSKGVETNTLGPGGLWVINDFKSEMMGAPFQGHGIVGWDPAKKKYVGTWVDSMSTSLSVTETTYDPATRSMNGYINSVGPDGSPMKLKAVTQMKDDDTRVFTLSMPGPDGKEAPSMRITYKRRK